ncbi:hypothetical protein F5Y02DRAFT_389790 [Annulohypoxylon stygium]|nr:hypothetical protein F5Y02DRAFT_389790 [Annulohypoxylon stygium]
MVQFICQILTNNNQPIVGMRVICTSSDSPYSYEGISMTKGVVGAWSQASQLYPHSALAPSGIIRCYFVFVVEEIFGPNEVPWPVIHVDIKLPARLANLILLRCDPHSYSLTINSYNPFEWDPHTVEVGNFQPNTHMNNPTQIQPNNDIQHLKSSFPSPMRDIEYSQPQRRQPSPFPSPMKGIIFHDQTRRRRRRNGLRISVERNGGDN